MRGPGVELALVAAAPAPSLDPGPHTRPAWVSVGDSGCGRNRERAQPLSRSARPSNCPGSTPGCSALHPEGDLDYAVKQLMRKPEVAREVSGTGSREERSL